MPLQFPSVESEVNLISLLSILNFGHGYRLPLKKATGRGAYDTIRALIFGLYLSSTDEDNLMSAKGLKSLSNAKIAELAQLTNHIHIEKAHPTIPGLSIGELDGPIYELVGLITSVLNETGTILIRDGYDSLGDFVIQALNKANQDGTADAEVVLDEVGIGNEIITSLNWTLQLIRRFPAFQDVGVYNGKRRRLRIHWQLRRAEYIDSRIRVQEGPLSPARACPPLWPGARSTDPVAGHGAAANLFGQRDSINVGPFRSIGSHPSHRPASSIGLWGAHRRGEPGV